MKLPLGTLLINEELPDKYRSTGGFTSASLQQTFSDYARANPEGYVRAIGNIRKLGYDVASREGLTVGLSDIEPQREERAAILAPLKVRLRATNDPETRRKIIADAQVQLGELTKHYPGTMSHLVGSGVRGTALQLQSVVASPVGVADQRGRYHPWMILHSYSEGLFPSELWLSAQSSRRKAVLGRTEISGPGEVSKILSANMADVLVTEPDCGTRAGITMSTTDAQASDRFLAQAADGAPAGTMLSPRVLTDLAGRVDTVVVRSPSTCSTHDGVCQKCAGLNSGGQRYSVGTNLGMRAAQSLAEPLTQMALSVKHRSSVSTGRADDEFRGGLAGLRQMLEIPANFSGRALVATGSGTVKQVSKAPQGGWNIQVGDTSYYANPQQVPRVKEKQELTAGDVITKGIPRPDEVVRYRGIGPGRQYLVDYLQKVYGNSGISIDRRHLETLAKAHLNKVEVLEDPDGEFLPGDVVDYNRLVHKYGRAGTVPVEKSVGRVLARGYPDHPENTVVTESMAKEFSNNGLSELRVRSGGPRVLPVMVSIIRNPLLNPDWLAGVGFRGPKTVLQNAAALYQESPLVTAHPIPAIFRGEVGQTQERGYYGSR